MTLTVTVPGTNATLFTTAIPHGLNSSRVGAWAARLIEDAARRMGVSFLALSYTVRVAS